MADGEPPPPSGRGQLGQLESAATARGQTVLWRTSPDSAGADSGADLADSQDSRGVRSYSSESSHHSTPDGHIEIITDSDARRARQRESGQGWNVSHRGLQIGAFGGGGVLRVPGREGFRGAFAAGSAQQPIVVGSEHGSPDSEAAVSGSVEGGGGNLAVVLFGSSTGPTETGSSTHSQSPERLSGIRGLLDIRASKEHLPTRALEGNTPWQTEARDIVSDFARIDPDRSGAMVVVKYRSAVDKDWIDLFRVAGMDEVQTGMFEDLCEALRATDLYTCGLQEPSPTRATVRLPTIDFTGRHLPDEAWALLQPDVAVVSAARGGESLHGRLGRCTGGDARGVGLAGAETQPD